MYNKSYKLYNNTLILHIKAVQDPSAIEAWEALTMAELYRDLGFNDIILEGDCLAVIKAIKDPTLSWCTYRQVIGDTKIVLNNRRSWMVQHVRRTANFVAHGLAKVAL
jgi:hypothetical protein